MLRKILCLGMCLALGAVSASAAQTGRKGRTAGAAKTAPSANAAPAAKATPALSGDLARLFPAETAVYFEFSDLTSAMEQLGSTDELYKAVDMALNDFRILIPGQPALGSEHLRALLASKVAVAVMFPAGTSTITARTFDNFSVAAVIRLSSPEVASVVRSTISAAESAAKTGPRAKVATTRVVGGVKLTVFPSTKASDTFAYGFSGDTIVAGTISAVTSVLQTASTPTAKRLGDSPSFASSASRLSGPHHGFVYINCNPVVRLFESGMDTISGMSTAKGPRKPSAAAAALKAFLGLKALKAIAATVQIEGPLLRVQAAAEIDRTTPGLVATISDPPTISFQAASFVPADIEYLTAYSVDAPRIYDLVLKFLTPAVTREMKMPPMSTNVAKAEEMLGMRLRDDLLMAFGNEVAIGMKVTSIVGTRTAPTVQAPPSPPTDLGPGDMKVEDDTVQDQTIAGSTGPEMVLLAEVRSPETVKRAIQQLAALVGAPTDAVRSTDRNGVEVMVAKDVAWAFLDGFMLIGSTTAVERCVDAHMVNSSLASSASFATWGAIPQNTIAASYLSPSVFATIANEVAKEATPGFQVDFGNPFPNGVLTTAQKDATGVYAQYDLPVRDAWKSIIASFIKSLTKAKTAGVQSEAVGKLRWIGSAEATYYAEHERFATLDELREANMISQDFEPGAGYRLELTVTNGGRGFAASITPTEYGKPARDSYFMDDSYVIRYADRQGASASASDPPVQ